MGSRRIWMTLAYDGADFCGFQRQPGLRTVQGEVERALSLIMGEAIRITGAGRTDAGVHARGQSIHFNTRWPGPVDRLPRILYPRLPAAIAVRHAMVVGETFHARNSALFRRYGYGMFWSDRADPLKERFAWRLPTEPDLAVMQEASALLLGKRSFRAFASDLEMGERIDSVRRVQWMRWVRRDAGALFLIQADGFLRHMVRNIMGSLAAVGFGAWTIDRFGEFLEAGVRVRALPPAPPAGLCLLKVGYATERME